MTAVPFPILRLPQRVFQKCLKQMSPVEHLSLSFVSIRTKQLISVLEKNYDLALITMSSPISFLLIPKTPPFTDLTFYFKPDQSIMEIRNITRRFTLEFSLAGFTEKQWIEHFSSVYIHNKDVMLYFDKPVERKIEDVYEYIKNLNIIRLDIQSSDIQEYQLAKLFPALEQLAISEVPTRTSIFVQNYTSLDAIQVTLDNVLASNCKHLWICEESLSDEDINLFMRHWIKGSNPNLRCLNISLHKYSEDIFEADFFQGISYIETMDQSDEYGFDKMFEIRRHDGAKASVKINECYFLLTVI